MSDTPRTDAAGRGWSPLHGAFCYVHEDLARQIERELVEVQKNYQFMVDRAANEKLDGYRELGAKAAAAEERAEKAERELAAIRDALAGTDYASLPSDFPTVRMAHTIRADHDKFLQQARDTCVRAEKAEERLREIKPIPCPYCVCNESPTEDELASDVCSACGKTLGYR